MGSLQVVQGVLYTIIFQVEEKEGSPAHYHPQDLLPPTSTQSTPHPPTLTLPTYQQHPTILPAQTEENIEAGGPESHPPNHLSHPHETPSAPSLYPQTCSDHALLTQSTPSLALQDGSTCQVDPPTHALHPQNTPTHSLHAPTATNTNSTHQQHAHASSILHTFMPPTSHSHMTHTHNNAHTHVTPTHTHNNSHTQNNAHTHMTPPHTQNNAHMHMTPPHTHMTSPHTQNNTHTHMTPTHTQNNAHMTPTHTQNNAHMTPTHTRNTTLHAHHDPTTHMTGETAHMTTGVYMVSEVGVELHEEQVTTS